MSVSIETSDYPTTSDIFDKLRSKPYVTNQENRGSDLENSEFDHPADVLYHECDWEPLWIKSRLKQYEGWEPNDWA